MKKILRTTLIIIILLLALILTNKLLHHLSGKRDKPLKLQSKEVQEYPYLDSYPYLDVLTTEYTANRQERQSRESGQVAMINFSFVVLASTFVLLSEIVSEGKYEYLLLPASIAHSVIGLLHLSGSYLQSQIGDFEHLVIRPKIERYLTRIHNRNDPEFEPVLTWEEWYGDRLKTLSLIDKIVKVSTLYASLIFSIGSIILFFILNYEFSGSIRPSSWTEFALYWLSLGFFVFHTACVLSRIARESKRSQRRQTKTRIRSY